MLPHRAAKCPAFSTSALPPGGTVLTAAASIAPVPDAVRIITSFLVWKTSLSPSVTSTITCLASAERWWITGRASSRRTSSGTIAGPGVISRGFRIDLFLGFSRLSSDHSVGTNLHDEPGNRHLIIDIGAAGGCSDSPLNLTGGSLAKGPGRTTRSKRPIRCFWR